ncbi:HD-GYP domain-containing protein [Neobacillus niacini]|uniref:HD-GYP domain-containing protein n=1 Tax=Neobacillus niacini TaxID=86668 RepID=UPI0007AC0CEC|nr:HD-GYP domain-containing protein [Neobacillus niacini]MEC1525644.1 HD-GYP domain-containing protein [Neobacillus niacini]
MISSIKVGSYENLLGKSIYFRIILFICLPIHLFIDGNIVYERTFVSGYILLMILTGFAFWNTSQQFFISFLITLPHFYFNPVGFPEWQGFVIQWGAYFLISFTTTLLIKKNIRERNNVIQLIRVLANTLDSKDPYTANHSEKVARYSLMIAEEMGLSKKQKEDIYIGGLLHDIGKIGVPESILFKQSGLTDEEFEKIKMHPVIGFKILKDIPFFRENGILDMILFHHERIDGNGYPKGLKGNEIPLVARIMAVADSYDAMTSNRIYREGRTREYAISEITKNIGIRYDYDVVNAFLKTLNKE